MENTSILRSTEENSGLVKRIGDAGKNYLIDTSAKVMCYAPAMAAMEAANGLSAEQIIKSRTAAAIVDAGAARIYGKLRDYVRTKVNADKSPVRSYLADTLSMIGTYTPVYAGILAANGANAKQIGLSLAMGAGIAALTARPYGKYVLGRWRKYWRYKKANKV
jgi:hypothetical protein